MEKNNKNKGYKYHYRNVKYHEYLQMVLERLERDVKPYINHIEEHAKKNNEGIGNFSTLRMLMPIIESIADIEDIPPQEILRKFDIKQPYLCWNLFRDIFIHGDEFVLAFYSDDNLVTEVYPRISISVGKVGKHYSIENIVVVDVVKLYYDLVDYLEEQISETNERDIQIISKIEYFSESSNPEVKKIIEEIKNKF